MKTIAKMMKLFLTLLILLILIECIKSSETCEAYYNTYSKNYIESFECPTYCCGLCSTKYCCTSESSRIVNQNACREKCSKYNNGTAEIERQLCYESGELCCGSCNKRYCCNSPETYLDQSTCDNVSNDSGMFFLWLVILSPCAMIILIVLSFTVIALKQAIFSKKESQRSTPNIYYSNQPIYDVQDADKMPAVFYIQNDLPPSYSKATSSGNSLSNPPNYNSLPKKPLHYLDEKF